MNLIDACCQDCGKKFRTKPDMSSGTECPYCKGKIVMDFGTGDESERKPSAPIETMRVTHTVIFFVILGLITLTTAVIFFFSLN